jgi:hypothetical protein
MVGELRVEEGVRDRRATVLRPTAIMVEKSKKTANDRREELEKTRGFGGRLNWTTGNEACSSAQSETRKRLFFRTRFLTRED